MPTPPYAKILVSVNGGAVASGKIVIPSAATIQLSGENTAGWVTQRWEFYAFPSGWIAPTGWSTDANGVVFSTAVTPPVFTLAASTVQWGKWLPRLTVNGGLDPAGGANSSRMMDTATGLTMASPQGLFDLAAQETAQFGASWATDVQTNWRTLDVNMGSGAAAGTGIDRKVLTSTGPVTPPVWAYPSEATFDWGKWGNCVFVFDPSELSPTGVGTNDINTLVDSSPLYRLGATANTQVSQGAGGYAQKVVSADFNNYTTAVFSGASYYYGGIIPGSHFFGDAFNFAVPRYSATNVAPNDYTMFWAIRLDAQAAPFGSATPIDYPALLEAQGGGIGTYFGGGNVNSLVSATSAGGAYGYAGSSVPFPIGAKKVITQRFSGSATQGTVSIRDGLGAWSSTATPVPPGPGPQLWATNFAITATWYIGANGALNRFFQGAIGYGVIYRAALPDWQCDINVKQLLGRFRW